MKALPNTVGQVVISKAGHDCGRYYAILRMEGNQPIVTDGENHPLGKPKKKNAKHLQAIPMSICVCGVGESGGAVSDGDIKKSLRQCKCEYETLIGRPEDPASRNKQKEDCALVQK